MNVKKLIAMALCIVMVLSMGVVATAEGEVSVDFEDGNAGFAAVFSGMANADASTLEVVEFNGSKALKVTNGSGKVPYVAIDAASLLGDKLADVASIEMSLGIENPDGKFFACSGNVIAWNGDKLDNGKQAWSVYMEKKNPKTATFGVSLSNDVAPIFVVTLDTDAGVSKGAANASLFIDDIKFLDADGNVIPADTSVSFVEPDGFGGGKDMSNLFYLDESTALTVEAAAGVKGGAWAQEGFEFTQEMLDALVPGAVVEISFSSANGDMWLVFPDAAPGGTPAWSRIEQQTAMTNFSKTVAQITYEEIVAVVGEDQANWGARMQFEASGDWEVYACKIGQPSGLVTSGAKVEIPGAAGIKGGAWAQDGVDFTEEVLDALVPGSFVEVSYSSAAGNMWLVFPDAAPDGTPAWSRIMQQSAPTDGTIAQISYEDIVAVVGEDKANWGARIQFESEGDWEVYGAWVAKNAMKPVKGNVEIASGISGGAWGQDGFEMSEDVLSRLVPGAVVSVQYTSTSGDLWLVFPDAAAGWSRIMMMSAACDGNVCQVSYEDIVAVVGEDQANWGARMQFESSGDWEVYTAYIGNAVGTAAEEAPAEEEAPVETEAVETEAVEAPAETVAEEPVAEETEAVETTSAA